VWNQMAESDGYIYDFIKSVQMPLFMAVSGYLAGLGHRERNFSETLKLIFKRGQAYLIPFFVWPVLLHPLSAVSEIKGILFQLDKGLWFLMTLFVVTVVTLLSQWISFRISSLFGGKHNEKHHKTIQPILFLGFIGIWYVLFFLQGRSSFTFLSPNLTLSYLLFYVAGYVWTAYVAQEDVFKRFFGGVFGEGQNGSGAKLINIVWWTLCVGFVVCIIALDLQRMGGLKDLLVQMAVSAVGVIVCFVGIYRQKKGRIKDYLALLGNVTLEFYIFQYALHGAFVKYRNLGDMQYNLYSLNGLITVVLTLVLMLVISIAGCFVIKNIPILDGVLFGHINRIKNHKQ